MQLSARSLGADSQPTPAGPVKPSIYETAEAIPDSLLTCLLRLNLIHNPEMKNHTLYIDRNQIGKVGHGDFAETALPAGNHYLILNAGF